VTGLSWRDDSQLVGCMCDGSLMRWTYAANNSFERINLNSKNQYTCIDYSFDGKRLAVAGLLPQIEIYDDNTLLPIAMIGN